MQNTDDRTRNILKKAEIDAELFFCRRNDYVADVLDKLKEEGKTMVFVTHSLDSARELCDRAVWLCVGVLKLDGKTNEVIEKYIEETA